MLSKEVLAKKSIQPLNAHRYSEQRIPEISEEVYIKVACLLNLLGIALKLENLHDRVKTITRKIRQPHEKRYCIILLAME